MGGYQQMVRGEPFRGKFRNSMSTSPEPFTPGKRAEIEFGMPDVCHTFRTGHRIMVQIQSSWFPLIGSQSAAIPGYPDGQGCRFSKGHRARLSRRSRRLGDPAAGVRVIRDVR